MSQKTKSLVLFSLMAIFGLVSSAYSESKSLKILLINGGCCHDYKAQGPVIKKVIESSLNAEVTIEMALNNKTNAKFTAYQKDDWAKGYDLIIHNECSASVTDKAYVKRILDAHRNGVPALNIHCAMHSYRWGNFKKPVKIGDDNANWFEMIGVQSSGHGPKAPVKVEYIKEDHPVTKGLKDWTTPKGELYNNVQVFDSAKVLAIGSQELKGKKIPNAAIVWTNTYGPKKTKTISISIGHTSEEIIDENFQKLLNRSVLWATDNINPDGSAKNNLAKEKAKK